MKQWSLIALSALFIFLVFYPITSHASEEGVLRATLANGLRVVIVKNTLAPVVTTEMNYLVGSNEAPAGFPGTAHAQEHMMFRGTPNLSAAQLANIMALMGGEFNADTQQTVTQYFLTIPKEDLDVALHLEAERMRGVLDTDQLWNKERGAIEQEVAQDLSNPEYLFYKRLLSQMFKGTPYAHDALGTRPSFNKTTGAMLKKFYDDWYAPNNAIFVIVGDVNPQKTLEKVKNLFGTIKKRSLPPRPSIQLNPLQPATFTMDTDLPYGMSVVAFRLPGFDSPDFAAGQILGDILNSSRSDLFSLVPQGKALFTGFEGNVLPKAGLGYAIAGFSQGSDGTALAAEIKAVIARYVKNGVPADLVEASKRHEIADAQFQKNSVSGLAAAWSQALAVEGRNSPDDDISAIRNVTLEDVNRVAREYLGNEKAITAVLTPRQSGKPISSKGYGGGESFTPKQTKTVTLPAWAIKAARLPSLPSSMVKPTIINLPNGIRLIVQKETVSPTVTIIGRIKSNPDLQAPEGKDGVDDLLDDLFSYGTTSLNRLEFQKAQDDIAADVAAGENFSLRVLSDHFDRGVELLADNLLHPALPESAFKIVKQQSIRSLAGQLQSPRYLTSRALKKGLYPQNDPKLRQATPKTMSTITLSDVRSYYRSIFRPDMTTIVIAGQVSAERARQTIEKYFGAWKASDPKPETEYPAVPPNKPAVSVIPDTSRVQDQVTLVETVGIKRSDPDYYKLQLGNHVLSGAFYASRLSKDLREKAGLVYTVDSVIQSQKTRTLFSVYYACDPPNVSRALKMIEENLSDMQTTPVTADELRLAKTLLVRRISLAEASVDSIANGLLSRTLLDLPLDEPVIAARIYLSLSAEQVRDSFKKWIRPSDFVQVTMGPQPN